MNIKQYLEKQKLNKRLTGTEMYFLKWILNNISTFDWRESISHLAQRASVSQSSISKFFNKIGISGYKGFCSHISMASDSQIINPDVNSLMLTINQLEVGEMAKNVNELAGEIVKVKKLTIIATNEFSQIAALRLQKLLRPLKISTEIFDSTDSKNIKDDGSIVVIVSTAGDSKSAEKCLDKINKFKNEIKKVWAITADKTCSFCSDSSVHIHGVVMGSIESPVQKNDPLINWRILCHCLDAIYSKVINQLEII